MKNILCFFMGRLALTCAIAMFIPYVYTIIYEDGRLLTTFSCSILICLAAMTLFLSIGDKHQEKLSIACGANMIFATWLFYALFTALPYILFLDKFDILEALVESISAITTTGLSWMNYDDTPKSLILWRSIIQWLGGLNILVLLIAIMPAVTKGFGIFFSLTTEFRTTLMTVTSIERFVFKVTYIYIIMTVFSYGIFCLSGLSFYDSLNLAMVTISTGGCYQDGIDIELNAYLYAAMLVGVSASCLNVLMFLQCESYFQLKKILQLTIKSTELRYFAILLFICGTICAIMLFKYNDYTLFEAISFGFFYVISFASTTGLLGSNITDAPELMHLIFLFLAILGGCMGSMSGGFKMLRMIILCKTTVNELKRTLHPKMVMSLKIGHRVVPKSVIHRILSLFFMYCVIIFLSMMAISLSGCTMFQAMYTAIACLTSTGQLIPFVTAHEDIYSSHMIVKLTCCFLMILGKVEFLSFFILIQAFIQKLNRKNW